MSRMKRYMETLTGRLPEVVTYHVTLGHDVDGERRPALEVGPFTSSTDALTYAVDSVGRVVADAAFRARVHGTGSETYYSDADTEWAGIVAGFTIERYSDRHGTDGTWSIEPTEVRVPA